MHEPMVFGLVGTSGSGKTTLALALISMLKARGLKVATIKHAHEGFDIDHPGKDSMRHREAGANEVLVSSPRRLAHIIERSPETEASLLELLARVGPVDVVLVEGFKTQSHPKIEVYRPCNGKPPLERTRFPSILDQATPGGALDLDNPARVLERALEIAVPLSNVEGQ